jgi:hypothetical protein
MIIAAARNGQPKDPITAIRSPEFFTTRVGRREHDTNASGPYQTLKSLPLAP